MAAASGIELARWAFAAGWRNPPDTTTAVAVAMRAGSDPDTPGGLYGIGQGRDGPSQAAAAYLLWKSRNQDWDVFPPHQDNGYLLRMPAAAAAVAALPVAEAASTVTSTVGGVQQAVTTVGDLAAGTGRLVAFLTSDKAWERMLKVAIGSVMILIAVGYIGKRGTVDQGARFLRKVGENADFIITARNATTRTSVPITPPRTARHTRTTKAVKAAPKPAAAPAAGKRAEGRSWSDYPTEPRPTVGGVMGTAKAPPRKLPGESAGPKRKPTREERRAQ